MCPSKTELLVQSPVLRIYVGSLTRILTGFVRPYWSCGLSRFFSWLVGLLGFFYLCFFRWHLMAMEKCIQQHIGFVPNFQMYHCLSHWEEKAQSNADYWEMSLISIHPFCGKKKPPLTSLIFTGYLSLPPLFLLHVWWNSSLVSSTKLSSLWLSSAFFSLIALLDPSAFLCLNGHILI